MRMRVATSGRLQTAASLHAAAEQQKRSRGVAPAKPTRTQNCNSNQSSILYSKFGFQIVRFDLEATVLKLAI